MICQHRLSVHGCGRYLNTHGAPARWLLIAGAATRRMCVYARPGGARGPAAGRSADLDGLARSVVRCRRCPRLYEYTREVARTRVRRHAGERYWGRPVPGFGDPRARLLVVGLAPAAHGANRTGRMFTGDGSGDWLARALYETGFASSPHSTGARDGLVLSGAYVTAAVRCAPPQNRPTAAEFASCLPYLEAELGMLRGVRAIVCLGHSAHAATCKILKARRGEMPFSHGAVHRAGPYSVVCSYHPSRQNTQTGRLSWGQWRSVFARAGRLAGR